MEPFNLSKIFLHFFDIHFLDEKGVERSSFQVTEQIEHEARLATRFAILSAEKVFIPASSFFESNLCYRVISELSDLYECGILFLVGGGASVHEFIEQKLIQYPTKTPQGQRYRNLLKGIDSHPPFYSKKSSSTRDICNGWIGRNNEYTFKSIVEGTGIHIPKKMTKIWHEIPDKLDGKAFIVDNVAPLLFKRIMSNFVRNRLHCIINGHYFASFTRELYSGIVSNLYYLASSYSIPSQGYDLPYDLACKNFRQAGLLKRIIKVCGLDLLTLKTEPEVISCLDKTFNMTKNIKFAMIKEERLRLIENAKIGIITALPEEFAAVCEVLGCNDSLSIPSSTANNKYSLGRIETRDGRTHTIAACLLNDMGNNSAAIRATRMLEHFKNIEHIFMVGIAGAVPCPEKPDDHVRLGDIVLSNRIGVVQYDLDKESIDIIEHRHSPRPPSAAIIEADRYLEAEELRGHRPWNTYIKDAITSLGITWRRPMQDSDILSEQAESMNGITHPVDPKRNIGEPRIFRGVIASANKLLKNPIKRNFLRDKFSVKAIEMESSGIADATWNAGVGYYVIRGTCDYCNYDKSDEWHKYAAVIAASYTKALLEIL